jgi:HTH-type transcriptional regulator/antitoxin HipB
MPRRLIHSAEQLSVLLKTARKARKLTQAEVAARVGVSTNRYSELEQQAGALTVERFLAIARELGLELHVQNAPGGPSAAPDAAAPASW